MYDGVRCVSYHCGVTAADELSDFMKDAFAVDAFVQRASLHNDGHGQQDLLSDILLQAAGNRETFDDCSGCSLSYKGTMMSGQAGNNRGKVSVLSQTTVAACFF